MGVAGPLRLCNGQYFPLPVNPGSDFGYFEFESNNTKTGDVETGDEVILWGVDESGQRTGYVTNTEESGTIVRLKSSSISTDLEAVYIIMAVPDQGPSRANIVYDGTGFVLASSTSQSLMYTSNNGQSCGYPVELSNEISVNEALQFAAGKYCSGALDCSSLGKYCTQSICMDCNDGNSHVCGDTVCRYGRCVECVTGGDCPGAPFQHCSLDGICYDCQADSECRYDYEICILEDINGVARGMCRECEYGEPGANDYCANQVDEYRPYCLSNNMCAECTDNNQCEDPSKSVCDDTGTCVGCTVNSECSGDTPLCDGVSGTCVSCINDNNCGSNRCDTDTHTCVGCFDNDQCTHLGDGYFCDLEGTMECIHCFVDDNDGLTNPLCLNDNYPLCVNGHCKQCETGGDCENMFGYPTICSLDGMCVQCVLGENETICDNIPGTHCGPFGNCVQCESNTDCNDDPSNYCSSGGQCVECNWDIDCNGNSNGHLCSAGHCVECIQDTDEEACGGSRDICNTLGHCVSCLYDDDCADEFICSESRGVCVQCEPEPNSQICNANGYWVECVDDEGCDDEDFPFCNRAGGVCVQCIADIDCPEELLCSELGICGNSECFSHHGCVGECGEDVPCACIAGVCTTDGGRVECTIDNDCEGTDICSSNLTCKKTEGVDKGWYKPMAWTGVVLLILLGVFLVFLFATWMPTDPVGRVEVSLGEVDYDLIPRTRENDDPLLSDTASITPSSHSDESFYDSRS
jgi:hypothetical protein